MKYSIARSMSRCPDWRKNKVSLNELRRNTQLFDLCPGVPVEENKARKDFSWWNIQLIDLCPDVPTEGKIKSVSMNWEEILNYSIYVPMSRLRKIKSISMNSERIFLSYSVYVPMSRLKKIKLEKIFLDEIFNLLDLCPDVPVEGKIKSVSMIFLLEILNYSIYVPMSRLKKIKREKIFLDEIFNLLDLCPDVPVEGKIKSKSLNELRRNTQLFDLCPDVPVEENKTKKIFLDRNIQLLRSMSRCPG